MKHKTAQRTPPAMLLAGMALFLAACSTTSNLPEGDVLYTGVKAVKVHGAKSTYAESVALTEVEAALAHAPNNSFMGSSSVRTPLPIGLWIYNGMVNKEHTAFGRWLLRSFGSTPVTIASVNPSTRAKVASNLLQNYGYFNGRVDYELVGQRNPRKQKIKYDIRLGEPYLYDSIRYAFRGTQDSIVQATLGKRRLKQGAQFSVADLQSERDRLAGEFRKNGYYFYRSDYIRFFADSAQIPQRVKLLVAPDADAPPRAGRQWHIGDISAYVRRSLGLSGSRRKGQAAQSDSLRQAQERRHLAYDDSVVFAHLKYAYQGEKMPIKTRMLFRNFQFWHGDLFDQSKVEETTSNLSGMQVFQQMKYTFTPRDTTAACDTLDVRFDATMDRLIETEFDFSFTQKSNSQIGPKAGLTVSKRNAFGHGETLAVGLKGSYEWYVGNDRMAGGRQSRPDSWEAGTDVSLSYPWLAFPGLNHVRFRHPASTTLKASADNLKRAGYYRLVSFGAEATYKFQSSPYSTHLLTPLTLKYNKLTGTSARFDSIVANNSALYVSMRNQFVPAMQYVYTYDNNSNGRLHTTTRLQATVKEAGNIVAGIDALAGRDFGRKEKQLFGTPYSQFLKINLELANRFHITDKSLVATRLQAGAVLTYGNSSYAPYSELFYAGGANSVRAFGVRTIGPGRYYDRTGRGIYLDQSGDLRLEANAEYRFNIVSNLHGALFIDAGNVWLLKDDDAHPGGSIGDGGFLSAIALGTGFGLRYDMEFLVLRLDLGIGIHAPYDTGRSSYYNIPRFSDSLGIHFAVGYPF